MNENNFYKIYKDLQDWRGERNIDTQSQQKSLLGNLYEELSEYYRAKNDNERVDALCDIAVFLINANERLDKYYTADDMTINIPYSLHRLKHYIGELKPPNIMLETILILRECFNIMGLMGYDTFKAMKETIKEINSRKQHPLQKKIWDRANKLCKKHKIGFNEALMKLYYQDRNIAISKNQCIDNTFYNTKFMKDTNVSIIKANYDKCRIKGIKR